MHRTAPVSIDTIDFGRAKKAFNDAIDKILDDVIVRRGLDKSRAVSLEVKISPELDKSMILNTPNIDWDVKIKMPSDSGMTTRALVTEDNRVLVNIDDELFNQTVLVGRDGTEHDANADSPPSLDNIRKLEQRHV